MSKSIVTETYCQEFIVPGRPVPAVRMTQRSKHYNKQAQRYLAYKDEVGWEWKRKYGGTEPFTGPVALSVEVRLCDPDKRRWDCSNVLKAIEDGLNGLAYLDDKQIHTATIKVRQASRHLDDDYVDVSIEGGYE